MAGGSALSAQTKAKVPIDLKFEGETEWKKQAFASLVAIHHECQTVAIPSIDDPKCVALWHAINSSAVETSPIIRGLLQHYAGIQNEVLRCVYRFGTDEEATEMCVGLMSLPNVSSERDVIALSEGRLLDLVQQSSQQSLAYGGDEGKREVVNIALLETLIKEKFIAGKKRLQYSDDGLKFECSDEFRIEDVIAQISLKEKDYFVDCDEMVLVRLKLELAATGLALASTKGSALEHLNKAKLAIEHVLIHIKKQIVKKDGSRKDVSEYMRDVLRLPHDEYELFTNKELRLCHLRAAWRFLEREVQLQRGEWRRIPNSCMAMYTTTAVAPATERDLNRIIHSHDNMLLWDLLADWRKFLAHNLNQPWPKASETPLGLFLTDAMHTEQLSEVVNELPLNLKLIHAGNAYEHCARFYEKKTKEATT